MHQSRVESTHSNCGASWRMSVHDASMKHEAFARSVLLMVRTTRSGCLTSGIGGNLRPRHALRTWRNVETAIEKRTEMPERVSVEEAITRVSGHRIDALM